MRTRFFGEPWKLLDPYWNVPNRNPYFTGRVQLERHEKLREAERHPLARVYPIGAVSRGLKGEELSEVGEMVEAGIVALSDDGLPVMNAALMRRALLYAQHFDIPVIQHAEDLHLTGDGVMHEGEYSTRLGLPGMPGVAEDVMVARDLQLTADTAGRYHVAHLSTPSSIYGVDGRFRVVSSSIYGVDGRRETVPSSVYGIDRGLRSVPPPIYGVDGRRETVPSPIYGIDPGSPSWKTVNPDKNRLSRLIGPRFRPASLRLQSVRPAVVVNAPHTPLGISSSSL